MLLPAKVAFFPEKTHFKRSHCIPWAFLGAGEGRLANKTVAFIYNARALHYLCRFIKLYLGCKI